MPRSNKNKSTGTKPNDPFSKYEFVNYRLTAADREACEKWMETAKIDVFSLVDELTSDGYKLSLSYSDKLSAATATLTNHNGPTDFQGKIISIRGREASIALARLIWLHFVMASSDWTHITDQIDDDIW